MALPLTVKQATIMSEIVFVHKGVATELLHVKENRATMNALCSGDRGYLRMTLDTLEVRVTKAGYFALAAYFMLHQQLENANKVLMAGGYLQK